MNSKDGNSFQRARGTGGQPTMYSHHNSNSQNSSDRSPNTSFQKWGSPATAPSSASCNNAGFSPYQKYTNNGQGYHDQRQFSPRFSGPRQFRTPQPVQRHSSPHHGRSWTGDFNNRFNKSPAKRFHNFKNRRFDVNCNPGGSNDIDQYYHPTMLQDPWQDLLACPINQAPPPTT
ncbi:hypothetical protein SNE40_022573 [Patella caerulea]|uniref:M-phase-specific PLK1-interacting protein n=1 Tax=Patella caerulea TaxID=87958 RepID=A0AAN8IXS6_PATCE